MSRDITSGLSLEGLRKEAKGWHKAIKAGDTAARNRLRESWRDAPDAPALRDVQYAIAREFACKSWRALTARVTAAATAAAATTAEATAAALTPALVDEWLAAAGAGDEARALQLLDAHPTLLDARGGEGTRTALHRAVFGGQLAMIQALLTRGANPNVRCEGDNAFPLHFAAEKDRLDMIEALVAHGAETIGTGDTHDLTVIGWATVFGSAKPDIVGYLLAHGARHVVPSAIVVGDVAAIQEAVQADPGALERPMDATNRRRHPLHLAVTRRQPRALEALVALGADLEATDAAGLTALDQAALQGERAMVDFLLARGAMLQLPAAVALGRRMEMLRLLEHEPGCLRPGGRWGTLIVRAAERGSGAMLEALVRNGADVNVADDPATAVDGARGYTALHAAAFHGNLEAARTLLALGANPCARDTRYAGTPAGWAAYAGHTAVRDLILTAPQDIFAAIEFGLTSRLAGAIDRDPRGLERAFGAYVSVPARKDQWWPAPWWTPLVLAVTSGNAEAVRLLLARGANDGVRSPDGSTLMHMAVTAGHADVVVLLRAHGESRRRPGTVPAGGEPDPAADPEDAFLRAALVPRDSGHDAGTLDEARAQLDAQPGLSKASIHAAAAAGDANAVRAALAADPASATRLGGPYGWDPLTHLCFSRFLRFDRDRTPGFVAAATALLDAGASATTGFHEGEHQPVPEFECVLYGACGVAHHPELTRLLLERGADANAAEVTYHAGETYDNRALHVLVEHGTLSPDSLAALLLRKADWHDVEGVRYLLAHGADANRNTAWRRTALYQAILRDNDLAIIEAMLDHGADPRLVVADVSPLALAARRGRADVLQAFAARGHSLRLEGLDALLSACARDDEAGMRDAMAREPQLMAHLNSQGGVHLARFAGTANTAGVRRLLDLGIPVDARYLDGDGYYGIAQDSTALHVAAWRGWYGPCELLIQRGADVNAFDGRGRSVLALAIRAGTDSHWGDRRNAGIVRLLLAAGARTEGVTMPTGWDEVDDLLCSVTA